MVKSFGPTDRVIDVGCGGGFPGLPMAILFPTTEFTLLDSNGKKMMIVEDLARVYTISLYIHYIYTMYTLYIHYIYTIYTLHIHYIYTIYTLYIHYIYTIYTLYIHYIYTI